LSINTGSVLYGNWDSMNAECDLCHTLYEPKYSRAGSTFTLARKDPPEWDRNVGPKFQLVPPYTYNDLARELNEAGWTSEVFHRRQFIICPSCAAKGVEKSEPVQAANPGEAK
jgi:hypothetical protein